MSKRFKEIVSVKDAYMKAYNNTPIQNTKNQQTNAKFTKDNSNNLEDESDYIKSEFTNQKFALIKDLEFSPEDFMVKKEEVKKQKIESEEEDFFNLSDLNMSFASKI